jgi:TPR repeat protein
MLAMNDKEFMKFHWCLPLLLCCLLALGACARQDNEVYAVERFSAAPDQFIQAAEKGDVGKMMVLARMYAAGKIDYHRDFTRAAYWYEQAADLGVVKAMSELGFIYEYGQGSVGRDDARALHWYGLASQHGHAYAQYRLAHVQAQQVTHIDSPAALAAYQSFLKAEQMSRDCKNNAECRIVREDLFNYRWQLEHRLSAEQIRLGREAYIRSITAPQSN